jgi:hypothetical protein
VTQPVPELLAEANYLLSHSPNAKPDRELLERRQAWLDEYLTWSEQYTVTGQVAPAVPQRIDGVCVWCRDPMPVPARPQGGGRTKRFCSEACKVASHRWTHDPDNNPDAQTWTLARRGLYATKEA